MNFPKELILFDTNVLIYAHNKESEFFNQARNLVLKIQQEALSGVITHQNLCEFYAIVTNPACLERPLNQKQAEKEIENYLGSKFIIIHPNQETLYLFVKLLKEKKIKSREVFDCYLVATMLANGVNTIYTANVRDFRKYKEIKVINPFNK